MQAVVIGGGIIGMLTARALLQRGCRVTLVDDAQQPPASWAGGGILSPLYAWRYPDAMNALCVGAVSAYRSLLAELADAEQQAQIIQQGGLWVAVSGEEQQRALDWAVRWQLAARPERLADYLRAAQDQDGVLFPALANIRNPRLLRLLRDDLLRRGIRWLDDRALVVDVLHDEPRVRLASGAALHAERLLISGGHGAAALLQSLGVRLPLFPAKGEILLYQQPPGAVPGVVLTEAGYLIPRPDGALLVGSTLRCGDTSHYPTVTGRYQLEALAASLLPALAAEKPRHHWAGVRPGSDQPYPFLGPVPGCPGVFAGVGHYRNGLVAAPSSAALLAALICAERPPLDPAPYSLSSRSSSSFFSR